MRTNEKRPRPRWTVRSSADLGRAIAGVRAERRLTQEDLAAETGIARSYIARLETGVTTLAVERALRLLRRMGATVTVSLGDEPGDGDG